MGAPVLALASWDSITGVVHVLFVYVSTWSYWHTLVWRNNNVFLVKTIQIRFLAIYQAFWLVKIVLGAHAALSLGTIQTMQLLTSAIIGSATCSWTPTIGCSARVPVTKIIKVVEHQIHVLLFFTL